jgi:hypothetical protein
MGGAHPTKTVLARLSPLDRRSGAAGVIAIRVRHAARIDQLSAEDHDAFRGLDPEPNVVPLDFKHRDPHA